MPYFAPYPPTKEPIAIAISELMIRLRSSTKCSKNVICPPLSAAASSGCSLFAIFKFGGLVCLLGVRFLSFCLQLLSFGAFGAFPAGHRVLGLYLRVPRNVSFRNRSDHWPFT